MAVGLMFLTNSLWLVIYVLIIVLGFRDRVYGMPVLALGGNICWEANYLFVRPYGESLVAFCLVWFVLDCVILYTIARFGPDQFPWLPKWLFLCCLGAVLAISWAWMDALIGHFEAESREDGMVYSGLAQNLMMSAFFLGMLAHRRSTAGQSLAIAACRLLAYGATIGTVFLWVHDGTVKHEPLLSFMLVTTPVLDSAYLIALFAVGRRHARRGIPDSVPSLTTT